MGCTNYAMSLRDGMGLPAKDPKKAAYIFDKACAMGDDKACTLRKGLPAKLLWPIQRSASEAVIANEAEHGRLQQKGEHEGDGAKGLKRFYITNAVQDAQRRKRIEERGANRGRSAERREHEAADQKQRHRTARSWIDRPHEKIDTAL